MALKKEPTFEYEYSVTIKPSPEMLAKIQQVIEEHCEKYLEKTVEKIVAEKIEEKLKELTEKEEKQTQKEIIKLKKISRKKAIAKIRDYIQKHPGCRTSDIIYDLALHPGLVLSVLEELEAKGEVRSENI